MKAIKFIQQCTLNFKLDPERLTIETPLKSELRMSGCGWDEGHEWYHSFPAQEVLAEVERCLRNKVGKSRIATEGKEYDFKIELDGGYGGRVAGSGTVLPVKAEFEIDIARKRITIQIEVDAVDP